MDIEIGQKIGKLIILSREQKGKIYHCACECGVLVTHWGSSLTQGRNRACPCAPRPKNNYKHGGKDTTEYKAWAEMKYRCYHPKATSYPRYGQRGIKVCDRWLSGFEFFLEDMGKKPFPNFSLERLDVNAHYSPENCIWADDLTQANNMRTNRLICHNGETKTLAQWARLYGINYSRLRDRFERGWHFELAVLLPRQKNASRPR